MRGWGRIRPVPWVGCAPLAAECPSLRSRRSNDRASPAGLVAPQLALLVLDTFDARCLHDLRVEADTLDRQGADRDQTAVSVHPRQDIVHTGSERRWQPTVMTTAAIEAHPPVPKALGSATATIARPLRKVLLHDLAAVLDRAVFPNHGHTGDRSPRVDFHPDGLNLTPDSIL